MNPNINQFESGSFADDPTNTPDGNSAIPGLDESESTTPFPKTNHLHGVVLLFAIIAVAAGVLFGMRKLGLDATFEFIDAKIDPEYVKSAALSVVSQDHAKMMERLRSSNDVPQIPLDNVSMNPFTWKMLSAQQPTKTTTKSKVDPELQRQQHIDKSLTTLTLGSVIMGQRPVANISGKLYRENDLINETFRVSKILDRNTIRLITEQGDTRTLKRKQTSPTGDAWSH